MEEDVGFALDEETVARSAYNAYRAAGGALDRGEWDGLALEWQHAWRTVARKAPGVLTVLEGRPYKDAALEMATAATILSLSPATPREELAWQAVTRHLATLFDGEDIGDLAALERSWAEWAARKVPELVSA